MAQIKQKQIDKVFKVQQITPQSTHLKKYFTDMLSGQHWSPGADDVECFLAGDPTSCYAAELNGKPIGTVTVFKYEEKYCHSGSYIIDEAYRGQGYGLQMTQEIIKRTSPVNIISLYGVPHMAAKYEIFGVAPRWQAERRMVYIPKAVAVLADHSGSLDFEIKQIDEVDFKALCNYDVAAFGYKRDKFLELWLQQSVVRVAVDKHQKIIGYAAVRKVYKQDDYRAGPVFCGSFEVAKLLLKEILQEITESQPLMKNNVIIDFPVGANPAANELSKLLDGKLILEVTFMSSINSPLPKGDLSHWFALTTMEIG